MAQWIKTDGTEQEVKPKNGVEFTLDEIKKCIGGYLEAVPYKPKLVMYVNEEGIRLELPYNARATQLIKEARPGYPFPIYGNVLIASTVETGDEPDVLRIPVEPVILPCEECHSENYPNYRYELAGMSGVLCKKCLDLEVANVNMVLNSTEDYLELKNDQ